MPAQPGDVVALTKPSFVLTGPGTPPATLLRSIWQSRNLIGVLARKDFLVRYRRTRLGLVWAVVLPALQAAVLAVVFSHVLGTTRFVNGHGLVDTPYGVFVFAGIAPWSFFSAALSTGSTAIVDSSGLAQRIYFPRLVLPLVAVVTAVYPFVITLAVLIVLIAALGPGLELRTLWLVPAALLDIGLVVGLTLLISALQVYLRDLRFAVAAAITVLFYLTPVIYPLSRLPGELRHAVEALPTAGPVELSRLAVGAADAVWWRCVLVSLVWTVVVGIAGFVVHCRRDRVLSDLM